MVTAKVIRTIEDALHGQELVRIGYDEIYKLCIANQFSLMMVR